jgi:hypothetical protein
MGKNNINGKTFLEKRYSEDLELEVKPDLNVPVYYLMSLKIHEHPERKTLSPAVLRYPHRDKSCRHSFKR